MCFLKCLAPLKNSTMKHHSILSLFVFLLGFGALTTSCEDMLTPDMKRYTTGFSGNDTVYFYHGILRNIQDMVEQNQLLGDIRSDLADTTQYSSDSVVAIATYDFANSKDGENALLNRAAYYKVINQCNFYLAKVDSMAKKNNIYYMRKELAQVQSIRAWTYLQLVQTYGKVPFITKPVDNANTGWESNPEAWATADNLVDLLLPSLRQAQAYEHSEGYPDYSNYNTGASSIASSKCLFYSDVVLGDLYLLRGASQNDYINAAKNYYYFLDQRAQRGGTYQTGSSKASFSELTNFSTTKKQYSASVSGWTSDICSSTPSTQNVTVIPSASNSSFGRVLTTLTGIYGYTSHSTNTTSTSTTTDGSTETTETTTTGTITLTPDAKKRQIGPSQAYLNLNAAQSYTSSTTDGNKQLTAVEYYEGVGDARVYGTTPKLTTSDGTSARFVVKDSRATSYSNSFGSYNVTAVGFKYYKGIYRMRQIYLRYAEAINRAGYPRLAFAVLRNGLDADKMPTLGDSIYYNREAKTKQTVYYVDSVTDNNSINWIGTDELRRIKADAQASQYLDFSKSYWQAEGIHEFGCGSITNLDSLYSYDKVISQRIKDEEARSGVKIAPVNTTKASARHRATEEGGDAQEGEVIDPSEYTTIDPVPALKAEDDEINAVESIIADECALELAFEGNRMGDLIRFARHKNNDPALGADYGTQWLAWKIARRSLNLAPYENVNEKDSRLYNLLLNQTYWYIQSPEY